MTNGGQNKYLKALHLYLEMKSIHFYPPLKIDSIFLFLAHFSLNKTKWHRKKSRKDCDMNMNQKYWRFISVFRLPFDNTVISFNDNNFLCFPLHLGDRCILFSFLWQFLLILIRLRLPNLILFKSDMRYERWESFSVIPSFTAECSIPTFLGLLLSQLWFFI